MVAGIHNLAAKVAGALSVITKLSATDTTVTLTAAEILDDGIPFVRCETTSAMTITMPAAGDKYKGRSVLIGNYGHASNDVTVHVAAGFGGTTAVDDVEIDAGEFGEIFCDGSYWYAATAVIPTS